MELLLIDDAKFENKKVRKLVQEINKFAEKQDTNKLKDPLNKLYEALEAGIEVNNILYTISIIAEKYPSLISKLDPILPFLKSESVSTRINAVSILGLYVKDKFDAESDKFDLLLPFLEDDEQDIRENVAIIVEELKDQVMETFFTKLPWLLKRINAENSTVVKEILVTIVTKFLGRDVVTTKKIEEFYHDLILAEKEPSIRNLMLGGLEQVLFHQKYEQDPEKKRYERIKARKPLVVFHDLEEEIKKDGITLQELKDFYREQRESGKTSGMFELDGDQKYFIEFEKQKLVDYLQRGKIPIKEIMSDFSLTLPLVNRLVKNLIKNHEIRGFLTEDSFLSSTFIKANMERDFKTNGIIDLADYQNMNDQLVKGLLKELQDEGKVQGIYTRALSKYYSFNNIKKELSLQAGKTTVLDLKHLKDIFSEEAFVAIEEEGKKNLFTTFHSDTKYLTHLGKIKLDQSLKDAGKLGSVDVSRLYKELDIPEEIILAYLTDFLQNKSGFWTDDRKKFFFYQYFESALAKAGMAGAKANVQLEQLSKEFGLPLETLQEKLEARRRVVLDRINTAPTIVIGDYMKEMGFAAKNDFLKFVDGLGRPYMEIGNNLIFDPAKIAEKKAALRSELRHALDSEIILQLTNWARRLNLTPTIVEEILDSLIQEEILNVLKLGDKYITELGIERHMLANPEMFELDTLFFDIQQTPLDQIQLQVVGTVLKTLITNKRLNGFYDEETQTFMNSTSMAAMSLNLKRNQVVEYLEGTKRQTFKTLDEIKAFVNGENIGPSQIEMVENLLKGVSEKYRSWNNERDRLEHTFSVAMREHKVNLKNILDENERKQEETRLTALEGEVNNAITDFKTLRGVIDALMQDIGKIFHLVKTIRRKPENVEAMQARLDEMLAQYYLK